SRVLGGGIVPGSVVLVSGDPGIGKSTLLIQLCAALADAAATALGNRLKSPGDIDRALEETLGIPGVLGAAAVMGEVLGVAGELELVKT
ncbi:MAG: AAA family ATPase, partial [Candidatus Geothermincolales bacterium]